MPARSFLINSAFSAASKLRTQNVYCWSRKTLVAIHWTHLRVNLICIKSFCPQKKRITARSYTGLSRVPLYTERAMLSYSNWAMMCQQSQLQTRICSAELHACQSNSNNVVNGRRVFSLLTNAHCRLAVYKHHYVQGAHCLTLHSRATNDNIMFVDQSRQQLIFD